MLLKLAKNQTVDCEGNRNQEGFKWAEIILVGESENKFGGNIINGGCLEENENV